MVYDTIIPDFDFHDFARSFYEPHYLILGIICTNIPLYSIEHFVPDAVQKFFATIRQSWLIV